MSKQLEDLRPVAVAERRGGPHRQRFDGYATPDVEVAEDPQIARLNPSVNVVGNAIHAILMKRSVVTVRAQVELETFAFYAQLTGRVVNPDAPKVRLTGHRAETGELPALELDDPGHDLMLILENLENGSIGVVVSVGRAGSTQMGQLRCIAHPHIFSQFDERRWPVRTDRTGRSPARSSLPMLRLDRIPPDGHLVRRRVQVHLCFAMRQVTRWRIGRTT